MNHGSLVNNHHEYLHEQHETKTPYFAQNRLLKLKQLDCILN